MILEAFLISSKVVVISIIISLLFALIAGYFLIEKNFKLKSIKNIIETILIFPMFLPPAAIGYLILLTLGKRGPIGSFLYNTFGIEIIFTQTGAIIVGIIVAIPIMYQNIKAALLGIDEDLKNAAREMGAKDFKVYKLISVPLCKKAIITGIILGIARVFGEFGATILVAGNIPFKTQTVSMAMYYAIENDDKILANTILILIVLISVILTFSYNKIIKKRA
ncbi:MAG: molybdate ABC transporter permease subunit [Sarcina sp.]